jgi:hypothetical protein
VQQRESHESLRVFFEYHGFVLIVDICGSDFIHVACVRGQAFVLRYAAISTAYICIYILRRPYGWWNSDHAAILRPTQDLEEAAGIKTHYEIRAIICQRVLIRSLSPKQCRSFTLSGCLLQQMKSERLRSLSEIQGVETAGRQGQA